LARNEKVKTGWKRPYPAFGSVIRVEGTEFVDREMGHGKNSELFVKMLSGFQWQNIIDPFMGTGPTLIACETTGLKCTGIERDASTFAIALQRFYDATHISPELN